MTAADPVPAAPAAPAIPPADGRRSALSLVDEAAHRLRLAPAATLGIYYAGTLPFFLALLYFWTDMSRSADAAERGTGFALALALLFLGMKTAHAVFAARLRAQFGRQPMPRWTLARLGRAAFVQSSLHAPGLFLLQVAAALILPTGWVYAFYQNVTALGDGAPGQSVGETARRAWRHALLESRANHGGLTILCLLGLFVWLNLMVAVVLLPQIIQMFTGAENAFTNDAESLRSTTRLAVTAAVAFLAVDPLIKTFYALRCFYEDSARTGEDLLSDLRALPPVAAAVDRPADNAAGGSRAGAAALARVGLILLLCGCAPVAVRGDAPTPPPGQAAAPAAPSTRDAVSPPALGHSIREVLGRREFAWRTPRPPAAPQAAPSGPIRRFFESVTRWMHDSLRDAFRTARDWFARLRRWMHRDDKPPAGPVEEPGSPRALLEPLVYVATGLLLLAVGWLAWAVWRGRGRKRTVTGQALAPAAAPPDLHAEDVLATQLPEDEWLRLARELLGAGERRLALRAMYLSLLAALGERGLLVVARHKSNRDYLHELRRRTRDRPEVPGAFGRGVGTFERVWYGSSPADDDLLAAFETDRATVLG